MVGTGKCRQQPHKTISDTERSRRQSAVNYARASVSLEGFSLSEADEGPRSAFRRWSDKPARVCAAAR